MECRILPCTTNCFVYVSCPFPFAFSVYARRIHGPRSASRPTSRFSGSVYCLRRPGSLAAGFVVAWASSSFPFETREKPFPSGAYLCRYQPSIRGEERPRPSAITLTVSLLPMGPQPRKQIRQLSLHPSVGIKNAVSRNRATQNTRTLGSSKFPLQLSEPLW